jgi:molybdopterin-guanine dinucleotide biosynthesis protein A
MRCAGVVLTGGGSTRLGRDKATLVLSPGGPMLAVRAAEALSSVATSVVEAGPSVTDLPCVREEPPGSGPLAAIGAAAEALGGGPLLVLACDMPFVDGEILQWLVDYPGDGSIVPVAGRPQPLCARWSRAALSRIPELRAQGEASMRGLVTGPDVTLADGSVWGEQAFADVDTIEDLDRVTARRLR